MKTLLVDGSNLLFQMFFGMPSRIIGKNVCAIHGTLGFIGALIRMIKMTDPTHIVVLFDSAFIRERYGVSPLQYADLRQFHLRWMKWLLPMTVLPQMKY